jgi:hypothetical protein
MLSASSDTNWRTKWLPAFLCLESPQIVNGRSSKNHHDVHKLVEWVETCARSKAHKE